MDNLLSIIAVVFYLSATSLILPGLLNRSGIHIKLVFALAMIAIITHGWLISDLIINPNGQNFSLMNVASLTGFIICFVLTLSMWRTRLWFLLPIVYCFAAINLALATFVPSNFITHFNGQVELLFHISMALFSYAVLTIGALYSIQFTWLNRQLKKKKSLVFNPNLPPLLSVERQLFRILLIGTILLTITLITGVIYVDGMFSPDNAHKTILSFVAWLIYCTLLWGHYQQGWRGRKVLWFSISGCAVLTLAYFGSRFVREIILS